MSHSSTIAAETASRLKLTITVIGLCIVFGSSYVLYASQRTGRANVGQPIPAEQLTSVDVVLGEAQTKPDHENGQKMLASPETAETAASSSSAVESAIQTKAASRLLVFINRFAGEDNGRLALSDALAPTKRALLDLRCARVYMAGGAGICLQTTTESQEADALILLFDEQFQETRRYYLLGIPSRARVSPDGTKAAYTNFITGHSYTGGVGSFSTDTRIVDMQRDFRIALEDFKAYYNSERFENIDFNYWGVTFATDTNRFYATLGTQGKTYIVEGNLQTQTVQVLTEGGECPSLSPDNRHLVFKERRSNALGDLHFQLVSYNLESGQRVPLGETRSVDDQVEWLDVDTIIYAMRGADPTAESGTELWTLDTSPDSKPQFYLSNAESPAVTFR